VSKTITYLNPESGVILPGTLHLRSIRCRLVSKKSSGGIKNEMLAVRLLSPSLSVNISDSLIAHTSSSIWSRFGAILGHVTEETTEIKSVSILQDVETMWPEFSSISGFSEFQKHGLWACWLLETPQEGKGYTPWPTYERRRRTWCRRIQST